MTVPCSEQRFRFSRISCTAVRLLSVKTASPVPKRLITEVMDQLKKAKPTLPVKAGEVIVPDVLGTGVNVIATRSLE